MKNNQNKENQRKGNQRKESQEKKIKKVQKKKGVALLMTLSIVLILSLALVDLFEKNAIEIKLLENMQGQFQADSVARSSFRVMLKYLDQKDETLSLFYQGLKTLEESEEELGFPIPIPFIDGVEIMSPQLKPMDHLFNLQCVILDTESDNYKKFASLVKRIYGENKTDLFDDGPSAEQIQAAVSSINDWTDPDEDAGDEIFFPGAEQYSYEGRPEFKIKNKLFDTLSEVRVLMLLEDLKIARKDWEKYFRIYADKYTAPENAGCGGEHTNNLNINLASKEEFNDHLKMYAGFPKAEPFIGNADDLGAAYIDKEDPENPFSTRRVFKGDEYKEVIDQFSGIDGLTRSNEVDLKLFDTSTTLWSLQYSVVVGTVTKKVKAVIKINPENKKEKKIVYFRVE